MPIPDEKKEHLRTLGYSDEIISKIEGGVEKASGTLNAAGVESKEAKEEKEEETTAILEETQVQEPDAEDVAEEPETEEPKAEEAKESSEQSLKEEIAQVIADTINPVIEVINAQQQENTELRKELADLKSIVESLSQTDAEKIAQVKEETPVRSLSDLVSQSIVGNTKAKVHGNTKLANDGPKEKETAHDHVTPIPFVNNLLAHQTTNGSS